MFNLAMGDIVAGHGVAVIDPHGDLAVDVLDAIPRSRINDVCYLNATDTERPVGFNPATMIAPERRALAAAGIVPPSSICGLIRGGRDSSTFPFTLLRR
jgi:hypothetical protein